MFVSLFAESFGSVVDYIFYAARLGHPRPLQFVHRHYEVIGLQGIKLSSIQWHNTQFVKTKCSNPF
jgi:hypothetical protein